MDILFILLLALILFGPKRLPEIARQIGKFVAEFKRASNDFKYQLQAEIDKAEARPSTAKASPLETTPQQSGSSGATGRLLPPAETPAAASPEPSAESEHERLMRTARMAYEAQAFSLRPPEPPRASTPIAGVPGTPPVPEPRPAAEPVSVPPAASSEPAGDSRPQSASGQIGGPAGHGS